MRDMVILVSLDGTACRTMARKLRAGQIYCKILPSDVTADEIREQDALGVLLCGGVRGEEAYIPHLDEILSCGLPVMAMGDAALTLCTHLGRRDAHRPDGKRRVGLPHGGKACLRPESTGGSQRP